MTAFQSMPQKNPPANGDEGVAVRSRPRLLEPAGLWLKQRDLLAVHGWAARVQPGTHVTVHQEQLRDGGQRGRVDHAREAAHLWG